MISLAHPLTIITGFIASPITSLNPTIGAGFVTALVQAIMVKPRIKDFEQLNNNSLHFKQWWENRLTKIFLVFLFSSIGSSIGTFVALPALISFFK
jgi:pheromone shutdown protein TraB